jgi:cytochrome c553
MKLTKLPRFERSLVFFLRIKQITGFSKSSIFLFFLLFATQSVAKTAKSIESTLSRCATCHGSDGNASANKTYPKLAGQNAVYLLRALRDFRPGIQYGRYHAVMEAEVGLLSAQEMIEIVHYYTTLPSTIDAVEPNFLPLGQRLYRGGDFAKGIPACLACHGPAGLGNPLAGFPRLSGQHAAYVAAELKAFRAGKRVDHEHQMMSVIAKKMSDADIAAVASYISGLY